MIDGSAIGLRKNHHHRAGGRERESHECGHEDPREPDADDDPLVHVVDGKGERRPVREVDARKCEKSDTMRGRLDSDGNNKRV